MSIMRRLRFGAGPGLGTFCVGLAFIVSASLLNVAHDRFTRSDFRALPESLCQVYDGVGKSGVTVMLVVTGLLIIGLGCWVSATDEARAAARSQARPGTPYFYAPEGETDEAAPGRVVLETRKYIPPTAALSGIPGWAAMQRKPSSE